MKIILLTVLLALTTSAGWTDNWSYLGSDDHLHAVSSMTIIDVQKSPTITFDAQEREQRSEPYEHFRSTGAPIAVITSSGLIIPLDNFVKSGKFCEIYGHRWVGYPIQSCPQMKCEICGKQRKKIKVTKEEEEWEK